MNTSDNFICLNLKKTNVQLKLMISCIINIDKHVPKHLFVFITSNKEVAIKLYSIGHTILNTLAGGVYLDLFNVSYQSI